MPAHRWFYILLAYNGVEQRPVCLICSFICYIVILHICQILNYLRTGELILDPGLSPEGVLEEARYYGLTSLLPRLESLARTHATPRDARPLTRQPTC